jgi:DNA helicase IV
VADPGDLFAAVAEETTKLVAELAGSIAVVTPDALVEDVSAALSAAGVAHGRATRNGLDDDVTVVPVSVVKGLELDGVVVVEPARIVADETLGLRALYVALTRPTQRLTVVHAEPLPPAMT